MERLSAIRLFCRIVETGGFIAAAKAMGELPSTVTRTVLMLEQQYGVSLFNRTTRNVALTEAGRVLYEHAERILQEADSAVDIIGALRDSPVNNPSARHAPSQHRSKRDMRASSSQTSRTCGSDR